MQDIMNIPLEGGLALQTPLNLVFGVLCDVQLIVIKSLCVYGHETGDCGSHSRLCNQ